LDPWGAQEISIEAQSAVPAGWYTDPAGSGGKRWWDGIQWTANLQAAPPLAPSAAVAIPQPQRIDPYANSGQFASANAYGNANPNNYGSANGYGGGPAYGNSNNGYARVPMQQVHQQHNSAAIGSVIVGAIAFCLSLVGLMPGSSVVYYSAGGILAIIGGARALMRRSQGFGTNVAAPIIAIVLGSLAVLFMVTGLLIHSTLGYSAGTTSDTTSNAQAPFAGGNANSTATVPTAPTFASDPALTAYEQTAEQVALAVDQNANGGLAYSPIPAWPAQLTLASDGTTILLPAGTAAAQLPSGQELKYALSADKKSFQVLVTDSDHTEIAIYDSKTNSFTWTCDASDTTCPPGGSTTDSSDTGGTPSNS
jgi:hypothetical protein